MKNYFGTNLKELLRKEDLTESELAKRTGVSQQAINKIINGVRKNPKLDTLLPIAQYFNIPLQDLVAHEGVNKEENLSVAPTSVPFVSFKEMMQFGIDEAVINTKKYISFDIESTSNAYYFATSMYDDSMEPKFPKGTILVFEKTKHVVSGDFCLLNDDENNCVFRQIIINGSKQKMIKCLNPNYEEYAALPLAINYNILATLLEARMVFSS